MSDRTKITSTHLHRSAFVYIRQSTATQLERNQESTRRQYALVDRAAELGWPPDRITVIDEDLGITGSGAAQRSGFARLTAEVALAHVGIVLGLEVSRLARNNADWYRLLDLCGLTNTLIGDSDGLYHPALFNDRLLLGLKGTMSEAELHIIRARLDGGIRNKAARGELRRGLPVGFVWGDEDGEVCFHPDEAVTGAISTVFQRFAETGFDEPRIDCIIMVRPTQSRLLYAQMVGRGTRLHPAKSDLLVIDVADNTRKHTLVGLHALFDLHQGIELRGANAFETANKLRSIAERYPWVDIQKVTAPEDLELIAERIDLFRFAPPEEVEPHTRLSWCAAPGSGYRLGLPEREPRGSQANKPDPLVHRTPIGRCRSGFCFSGSMPRTSTRAARSMRAPERVLERTPSAAAASGCAERAFLTAESPHFLPHLFNSLDRLFHSQREDERLSTDNPPNLHETGQHGASDSV